MTLSNYCLGSTAMFVLQSTAWFCLAGSSEFEIIHPTMSQYGRGVQKVTLPNRFLIDVLHHFNSVTKFLKFFAQVKILLCNSPVTLLFIVIIETVPLIIIVKFV